jgi:hypothetical protein
VEFPPPSGPIGGKEGELDLWLEAEQGSDRLHLVVECKKNNPEFVNWVFFRRASSAEGNPFVVSQVTNQPRDDPPNGWTAGASIRTLTATGAVTIDGRETRGDYSRIKDRKSKTRTANNAIRDAAYQVALSTKAIVAEQLRFSQALGGHADAGVPPWMSSVVFPVIVTTAHLFECAFDPENVDPATGELPLEKVSLQALDQVIYEYALPRHLQSGPADLRAALVGNTMERFWRMHLLVIQSTHFARFLQEFFQPDVALRC